MGKLVTVVGNSGSGKTTLVQLLSRNAQSIAYFEQHADRPFQAKFADDLKQSALPNQIDYLLYRASQEQMIRAGNPVGIQDGGLDLDFYVFTHHFARKGYLNQDEFALCERLHTFFRQVLPEPDLVIRLETPIQTLVQRRSQRNRRLDILASQDLADVEMLLNGWLNNNYVDKMISIDSTEGDFLFSNHLDMLSRQIGALAH